MVDGVAGERAQEDVVADHVQRRQAAHAVQARQPRRGRGPATDGSGSARSCDVCRHPPGPNVCRKRSRNTFIGQTGAVFVGLHARHPAPPGRAAAAPPGRGR